MSPGTKGIDGEHLLLGVGQGRARVAKHADRDTVPAVRAICSFLFELLDLVAGDEVLFFLRHFVPARSNLLDDFV